MNHIISDLDQKYKEITNEKDHHDLLIKIIDYSKYLETGPATIRLLNSLVEASKQDIAEYSSIEKKFLQKFEPLVKDILKITEDLKIKDNVNKPLGKDDIARLNEFLQGKRKGYFYGDLDYPYRAYVNLVQKINDVTGGQERLLQNHLLGDGRLVIGYEYQRLNGVWKLYKKLRSSQVWWAHYQIQRLQYGVMRQKEANPYFNNDEFIDHIYQQEFDQILAKGEYTPIYLKMGDFRTWIGRLHNYLLARLREPGSKPEITVGRPTKNEHLVELPNGWKLEEKGQRATLSRNGLEVLTFPNAGSDQYRYFKVIVENYPQLVTYQLIYEDVKKSKHPSYGKQTHVNQNIRTSINKLRNKLFKALKSNNIPEAVFDIVTAKGFRLQIA